MKLCISLSTPADAETGAVSTIDTESTTAMARREA